MTAEPGPGAAQRGWGILARAGHLEYDRILFFSDAVFAIAITLLIVDLPVRLEQASSSPSHHASLNSATELRNAVPGIEGFGISFAVIGLFWIGHHSLFRFITAFDRPLMALNLLFLGTIAFLPYPTALLSSVSSSQAAAVIFYAACAGGAGLVETLLWLYAVRARDGLVSAISPATRRLFLLRTARVPAVFGLSMLIALAWPRAATYFWLAIAVSGAAIDRIYRRGEPGLTTGPAAAPEDPPAAAG